MVTMGRLNTVVEATPDKQSGGESNAQEEIQGQGKFQSVMDLWAAYNDLLWENGKHKDSCHAYAYEIFEIMRSEEVYTYDNDLLDRIIISLRKKGNRNSTINRKMSLLSKLLRKHYKNGHINRLPEFNKLPENNSRVRFLSFEEEDRLFASLGDIEPDYRYLSIILVDTGARIGEALRVRWSDNHKKTITFWETKSKTPRTLPVTERVDETLRYLRQDRLTGPFGHIKYYKFLRAWNEAKNRCDLAGDRLVVPHILRHTCASRLAQSGVDIKRIQEFLGHKTLQMTLRYAHLSPKHLEVCADVLSNIRHLEDVA